MMFYLQKTCYPDSLVQRAGRINRFGLQGNNGEGIVRIFLPNRWKENKITASLPYNFNLMSKTIDLLSSNLIDIESETRLYKFDKYIL